MPNVTDFDELYQCQICFEMYDEMKIKPMMFYKCQHNVCRICLSRLIKKTKKFDFKNSKSINLSLSLNTKIAEHPMVECPYCKVEYKMNSHEILENQTTIKLIRSQSKPENKTKILKDSFKRRSTLPETVCLPQWDHDEYLKTLFENVDKNSDGTISDKEIHEALINGQPNEILDIKTVQLLAQKYDGNNDGEINLKEFKDLFIFLNDEYVCFLLSDLDGNQKIDSKELHRFFKKRGYNFDKSFSNHVIETIKINTGKEISFDLFLRISVRFQYLIEHTESHYSSEMTEKFIQKCFFDDFWMECTVNEPIIKKTFSNSGGKIITPQIDLIVPPNAVKKNLLFIIKQASISLKKIEFVEALSPVYELIPHSVEFNVPIILRFKKTKNSNGNICLYKQNDNEIDRILNKWTIHFPKEQTNDFIEFELTSFSFAFLGSIDVGIDINCEAIRLDAFNQTFQPYQHIKAGLNYRIKCNNENCENDLIICNREFGNANEFGKIRPNEDVAMMLRCSKCNSRIQYTSSIKALILFQVEGSIEFRLDPTIHHNASLEVQETNFRVNSNNIVIFGDENVAERYDVFIVNVRRLENEMAQNIAGLSLESTRINLNLPNSFDDRRKGFVTTRADPYFHDSWNCTTNFAIDPESNFPILNSERLSSFFEIKKLNNQLNTSLKFKIESGNNINNMPVEIIDVDNSLRNEILETDENYCLYKLDDEENDKVLKKWSIYIRPTRQEINLLEFEIDLSNRARVFFGRFNLHFNRNFDDFRTHQIIHPGLNYVINCSRLNCFGIQNIIVINKGSGTFRFDDDILPNIECSICRNRISSIDYFRAIVLFKVTGDIRYKLRTPGATLQVKPYCATNDKLIVLGAFMGTQFEDFYIGVRKVN